VFAVLCWSEGGRRKEGREEGGGCFSACAGRRRDSRGDVQLLLMTELDFVHRPAAGETGVAEALRNQTSLERLYIRGTWFRDDQGEELGAVLPLTSLKELYLSEVNMGERGFKSISWALEINTTITHLYLEHIPLGLPCAEMLAEMLVSNSVLKVLTLDRCLVGALGSRATAHALKKNTSLEELLIANDKVENTGAFALADTLASTKSLKTLRLNGCEIVGQGALALGRAWGSNLALPLDRDVVQGVEGARQEAVRVRGLRRREQLVAFGMAMITRLGGGPGEETTTTATATATATATSSGSESKMCVFHLMDGDVFKLIGEAYGDC
jgi:hypothetical protein